MSIATLSPEAKLRDGLVELGCAVSNFAKISQVVGTTRLSEGLTDSVKSFTRSDAARMLAVLGEMKELAKTSPVPPDWKETEKIREALRIQRAARNLIEEI